MTHEKDAAAEAARREKYMHLPPPVRSRTGCQPGDPTGTRFEGWADTDWEFNPLSG